MSEENFIALENKFVTATKFSQFSGYKSNYNYKQVNTPEFTGTVTFNALVVKPNAESDETESISQYEDYTTFHKSSLAEKYSHLGYVIDFIKNFKNINSTLKLTDPNALDELLSIIEKAHEDKQKFYNHYGDFSLKPTREIFPPSHNERLKYLFEHPEGYEKDAEKINKNIRKCKALFEQHVKPYIFEQLKAQRYGASQQFVYKNAEGLNYLFPLASVGLSQKALLAAFKKLKEQNKTIFDCYDSIEKRNAKKDLKGYALYQNHGDAEGFVNNDGLLTKNLLSSKIFETSEQAYLYSKRRKKPNCIVVELDFSFSKIIVNNDCAKGETMSNLIARREESTLKDLIPMVEEHANDTSAKPKKHKI